MSASGAAAAANAPNAGGDVNMARILASRYAQNTKFNQALDKAIRTIAPNSSLKEETASASSIPNVMAYSGWRWNKADTNKEEASVLVQLFRLARGKAQRGNSTLLRALDSMVADDDVRSAVALATKRVAGAASAIAAAAAERKDGGAAAAVAAVPVPPSPSVAAGGYQVDVRQVADNILQRAPARSDYGRRIQDQVGNPREHVWVFHNELDHRVAHQLALAHQLQRQADQLSAAQKQLNAAYVGVDACLTQNVADVAARKQVIACVAALFKQLSLTESKAALVAESLARNAELERGIDQDERMLQSVYEMPAGEASAAVAAYGSALNYHQQRAATAGGGGDSSPPPIMFAAGQTVSAPLSSPAAASARVSSMLAARESASDRTASPSFSFRPPQPPNQ